MADFQYQLRVIMATILWIVALTSTMTLVYVGYFIKNTGHYKNRQAILTTQISTGVDLALALIIGICAGILLEDLKVVFYSFIATIISSVAVLSLCIFFNSWFIFGWNKIWTNPWDWEIMIAAALANSFTIIFPGIFAAALFGVLIGSFVREFFL